MVNKSQKVSEFGLRNRLKTDFHELNTKVVVYNQRQLAEACEKVSQNATGCARKKGRHA